jgi:hypothetical protein
MLFVYGIWQQQTQISVFSMRFMRKRSVSRLRSGWNSAAHSAHHFSLDFDSSFKTCLVHKLQHAGSPDCQVHLVFAPAARLPSPVAHSAISMRRSNLNVADGRNVTETRMKAAAKTRRCNLSRLSLYAAVRILL